MATTSDIATWIWYPGDFEVWLGNKFNNRRTERGAMFPPFWKQDSHYVTVEFSTKVNLKEPETIKIEVEGYYNFMLDGKLRMGEPLEYVIPAGEHSINIKVHNQATPPAIHIDGKTIKSNSSWLVTYEDKIWIDENGVAHGSGIYVPAASSLDFLGTEERISNYALSWEEIFACHVEKIGENGRLFDFGKETFGYIHFNKVSGTDGRLRIYYGESREEALDKEHCETLDEVCLDEFTEDDGTLMNSKAFRYVYIETDGDADYHAISALYEFAGYDEDHTGAFRCDNELLNKIWEVGAYTMDLTTREFFMDGIKRDRWTWSGDAIQSYLMNYYLRFDSDCVRRTIRQLRGKDPVTAHINTIMDYTFYWFKSVLDFYTYTGDTSFVREIYPRMRTMMQYVLGRLNDEGMAEGKEDDWIFVDWVDFPMHKRGILCFEQILLCKSFETMQMCAAILRDNPLQCPPQGSITTEEYAADAEKYASLKTQLHAKLKPTFWNDEKHAFMHAIEDGQMNTQITKFPNMFAIIYDMISPEDKQQVMQSVMLNPQVEPITTPYMRFYELEALCQMGMQEQVTPEMLTYWGGMLKEGATTFWEKYVPTETGTQHLAMYGRPYGKSLCHAWGASPVYLLGKYYLGVSPTKPGYEEYAVKPCLGGLQWMEGDVPTPFGLIHVRMDKSHVTVKSDGGKGTLIIGGKNVDIPANKEITIEI